VSPDFVAFASPSFPPPATNSKGEKIANPAHLTEEFFANYKLPKGVPFPENASMLKGTKLTSPFKNVLSHFLKREVGLVVRLNSHLYPAQFFSSLGMTHLDMIFDDGTCPPLSLLRKFINLAHEQIVVKNKKIAVHCKAGLGRTGCLIGAYLIYRYGFTANECIAYMRFMRPGMVVGPQQHWLHLHQQDIRQWWHEDRFAEEKASLLAQIQSLQQVHTTTTPSKKNRMYSGTPPPRRSILGELTTNESNDYGASLPAPTPGQPRKNSSRFLASPRHYNQEEENRREDGVIDIKVDSDAELDGDNVEDLSEEEIHLRLTASKRHSQTRSPVSDHKRRSVSYTITTTSTTISTGNTPPGAVTKSGNGLTTGKVRSSPRRNNTVSGSAKDGVRKTSGRVGSHGTRAL